MPHRDMIVFSGGLDSTVLLAASHAAGTAALAVTVDYGQRHRRELAAAALIAAHYQVPQFVVDLTGWGRLLTGSALTDPTVEVPHGHYTAPAMASTVVPNRNATLLMVAVGIAQARLCDRVLIGVHAGDHPVYADCRPDFIAAAARVADLATAGHVTIRAPFLDQDKAQIVKAGAALGSVGLPVPFALTWSCYEGGSQHCGRCGTCVERREAFHVAGVVDPTVYQEATE
jgi:7-cyano-7-deazaguanine synthase